MQIYLSTDIIMVLAYEVLQFQCSFVMFIFLFLGMPKYDQMTDFESVKRVSVFLSHVCL